MPDDSPVRGVLYAREATAPVPVAIRVLADRVEATPDGGSPMYVLLAEASVRPGGFDGDHVFVLSADEAITIASNDSGFVPALEAVADARLSATLATVAKHRLRHVRRTFVERWAWRLRWAVVIGLATLALVVLLRWF